MTIQPVSFSLYDADFPRFAAELGASFERYGFAVVGDHDLPPAVIDDALLDTKSFFALPAEEKMRSRIAGAQGQRGYTPFGVETAKGAEHFDLKEFWHVGRELPAGHRFRDHMPDNVWPEHPPGFREHLQRFYDALDSLGERVLRAVARHLRLADDFFDAPVRDGNSVLRLLHYPPVSETGPHVRAGAHEDINVITLLLGAEEAGLEIRERDGSWLAGEPAARRHRGQHRRHAAAADQRRAALHQPPGGEPGARAPGRSALLDALLPALRVRLRDPDVAGLRVAGEAGPPPGADHRRRLPPGAPARDQARLSPRIETARKLKSRQRMLLPSGPGERRLRRRA